MILFAHFDSQRDYVAAMRRDGINRGLDTVMVV